MLLLHMLHNRKQIYCMVSWEDGDKKEFCVLAGMKNVILVFLEVSLVPTIFSAAKQGAIEEVWLV